MIEYGYDSLKRQTTKTLNNLSTTYEYASSLLGEGYTTNKIEKENINGKDHLYTYDEVGNIIKIEVEEDIIEYEYDNVNRLIREDNGLLDQTIVYAYDNGGNLLRKTEYEYTMQTTPISAVQSISYTYGNEDWKDQLTNYNDHSITYDAIGNPLTYLGKTMTWNGRQLLSVSEDSDTISYTYDVNGTLTKITYIKDNTETEYYATIIQL